MEKDPALHAVEKKSSGREKNWGFGGGAPEKILEFCALLFSKNDNEKNVYCSIIVSKKGTKINLASLTNLSN